MGRYNWENRADRIGDLTVKTNISSTFCFLMFVILGLRVALAGGLRSSIAQRRRTNIFLCAVLLILLLLGNWLLELLRQTTF